MTNTTTASQDLDLTPASVRIHEAADRIGWSDEDRLQHILQRMEAELVLHAWQLPALDALQWRDLGAPMGLAAAVRRLVALKESPHGPKAGSPTNSAASMKTSPTSRTSTTSASTVETELSRVPKDNLVSGDSSSVSSISTPPQELPSDSSNDDDNEKVYESPKETPNQVDTPSRRSSPSTPAERKASCHMLLSMEMRQGDDGFYDLGSRSVSVLLNVGDSKDEGDQVFEDDRDDDRAPIPAEGPLIPLVNETSPSPIVKAMQRNTLVPVVERDESGAHHVKDTVSKTTKLPTTGSQTPSLAAKTNQDDTCTGIPNVSPFPAGKVDPGSDPSRLEVSHLLDPAYQKHWNKVHNVLRLLPPSDQLSMYGELLIIMNGPTPAGRIKLVDPATNRLKQAAKASPSLDIDWPTASQRMRAMARLSLEERQELSRIIFGTLEQVRCSRNGTAAQPRPALPVVLLPKS